MRKACCYIKMKAEEKLSAKEMEAGGMTNEHDDINKMLEDYEMEDKKALAKEKKAESAAKEKATKEKAAKEKAAEVEVEKPAAAKGKKAKKDANEGGEDEKPINLNEPVKFSNKAIEDAKREITLSAL